MECERNPSISPPNGRRPELQGPRKLALALRWVDTKHVLARAWIVDVRASARRTRDPRLSARDRRSQQGPLGLRLRVPSSALLRLIIPGAVAPYWARGEIEPRRGVLDRARGQHVRSENCSDRRSWGAARLRLHALGVNAVGQSVTSRTMPQRPSSTVRFRPVRHRPRCHSSRRRRPCGPRDA